MRFLCLALCGIIFADLHAQEFDLTPDHTNGVYEVGQPIRWKISRSAESADKSTNNSLSYTLRNGGLTEIAKGTVTLTNNVATLEGKLDSPGTLLAEIKWGDSRQQRALGGAVAAPTQIGPSTNRPADFDAFWAGKIRDLEAIPANPKLDPVDLGLANVDYWKITMDNIRDSHIRGQIARPKAGEKLPALLIVQWAGVYPLQRGWVTNRAAQGWLTLNIEAHDLPIDEPQSFYQEQSAGPLKDYPAIGNEDRETGYFLRMYLSCYRAAQYLTERPDWDGRTLVVMGDSQGGMQTIVTAGLHSKISGAIALVPAGCDLTGPVVGRDCGWPHPYFATNGKDAAKVHETSRYFDAMNFAPRIQCPILIGLGLIDETCPPVGIFVTINQITASKETVILVKSGHQDVRGSQETFRKRRENVWLPALQKGQIPK